MTQEQLVLTSLRIGFGVFGRIAPSMAASKARDLFTQPRRFPRPERERALLARGSRMQLAGLSATSFGEGPTILLVHGWEGRGAQLGALVDPLVAKRFRVVALDGPAHGDSPGTDTNPHTFGDALVRVGRELGPLHGVVAHSFGSICTMVAIARGLAVERVVFLGGASQPIRAMGRFAEMLRLPDSVFHRFVRKLEQRVGVSEDALDGVRLAHGFSQPALFLHDPNDAEVPISEMEALIGSWRGSRLERVSGPGHRRILYDPAVVARVTEFFTDS